MRLALVPLLLIVPLSAHSHGGGLNAEGCHNNRKAGDYHCHRAPSYDRGDQRTRTPPKSPAPSRLIPETERRSKTAPSGDGPTCYVGPRGGTYTITPSGRKNYRGC